MTSSPTSIVSHEPMDTAGHEPDPHYDTILRVLDIDNDLVKKHLIIAQGIDQSILVPDLAVGYRIMFEGSRPENVRQCFCINNDRRGWGYRLGYVGNRQSQNREQGPVKPSQSPPKMKTEIESQISYQRETLQQL